MTAKQVNGVMPLAALLLLLAAVMHEASAKPTIYVKNDNDKLEPVLVPVSSTVIPLPVYKVGFSLGAAKGGERERPGSLSPGEPIKLITVHHKKKASSAPTKEKASVVGSS